eukprot:5385896-Alexandrium_andersonii.AAC.1
MKEMRRRRRRRRRKKRRSWRIAIVSGARGARTRTTRTRVGTGGGRPPSGPSSSSRLAGDPPKPSPSGTPPRLLRVRVRPPL